MLMKGFGERMEMPPLSINAFDSHHAKEDTQKNLTTQLNETLGTREYYEENAKSQKTLNTKMLGTINEQNDQTLL